MSYFIIILHMIFVFLIVTLLVRLVSLARNDQTASLASPGNQEIGSLEISGQESVSPAPDRPEKTDSPDQAGCNEKENGPQTILVDYVGAFFETTAN